MFTFWSFHLALVNIKDDGGHFPLFPIIQFNQAKTKPFSASRGSSLLVEIQMPSVSKQDREVDLLQSKTDAELP